MKAKTLAFAIDRDQIHALRDASAGSETNNTIATADWQVAAELKATGQPYIDIWSYLASVDIDRAYKLCQQLAAGWWQPLLGEIKREGIQLADAMSRDMWFFFTTSINAYTAITRILDAEKPDRLILFSDEKKATFWNPPDGPYPDVFNAVALWIARQRRLPVQKLTIKRKLAPAQPEEDVVNMPSKSITLPELPFKLPSDSRRGTILIFVDRIDYHKQRDLIKNLGETQEYNTVLLRTGYYDAPEFNSSVLDWEDYFDWFLPDPSLKKKLRKAWGDFKHWQKEYSGDFPYIFANAHLNFQFKAFWERLAEGARIVDAATLVCHGLQPDLCIFGLDTYGPGMCWNRAARECGVTTLSLPHGVISPHFYRYDILNSESDYQAVEGEYSRKAFQALGRLPETFLVASGFSPITAPASSAQKSQGKSVLLMTTLSGYGLAAPVSDQAQLRHDWQHMTELIERRQDIHFIFKPNPRYDYYDFYRSLCARFPSNLELREGINLREVFPEVSVAVMVNYPSTAALEAILAGVPLVYLRSAVYRAEALNSPLDSDNVICVDRIDELETILDNLLTKPAARTEARRKAEAFLTSFLTPGSVKESSDKILELMQHLARKWAEHKADVTYQREEEIMRDTWTLRHYIGAAEEQGLRKLLLLLVKRYFASANTWKRGSAWLAWRYLSRALTAFNQQRLAYAIKYILLAFLWNPALTVREAARKVGKLCWQH